MKISILSILLFTGMLLSSLAAAQSDSLKTVKIKDQTVEIGKYYEVVYVDDIAVKGKLIAVNKITFLMFINNQLEEFNNSDVLKLNEIEADNIVYTLPKPRSDKPVYSLSIGYLQKAQDKNNSDFYGGLIPKMGGFDIQGDALIKTSENFGFRIDINYFHIFGKTGVENSSFYYNYDSTTSSNQVDYKDINTFTAKTGICFGSMRNDLPFNFYLFIGLGFGWMFKDNDINYYYRTKNNVTTVTQSTTGATTGFMVGIHGQIRLSYKINKNYRLFVEPTFQYWGNKIDELYGINGGITFLL